MWYDGWFFILSKTHVRHYKQHVTNRATRLTKPGPSWRPEEESSARHEVSFTRTFRRRENVFPPWFPALSTHHKLDFRSIQPITIPPSPSLRQTQTPLPSSLAPAIALPSLVEDSSDAQWVHGQSACVRTGRQRGKPFNHSSSSPVSRHKCY